MVDCQQEKMLNLFNSHSSFLPVTTVRLVEYKIKSNSFCLMCDDTCNLLDSLTISLYLVVRFNNNHLKRTRFKTTGEW